MRLYSPHFSCLYDEHEPVGKIGNGTHYSVLRTAEWRNVVQQPLKQAEVHDFAVIWDEDHDERVVDVAERIYMAGLFSPIQFIGERKGTLTVVVAARFWFFYPEATLLNWKRAVAQLATDIDGDTWNLHVGMFDKSQPGGAPHQTDPSFIVQDTELRAIAYLRHIDNLWNLGTWPFKPRRTSR